MDINPSGKGFAVLPASKDTYSRKNNKQNIYHKQRISSSI